MDDEVYSFALKTTLNEIQSACSEIKNAFIFREDGEILATDSQTSEKTAAHIINAFDGLFEREDSLGDLEAIVLNGTKGRVSLAHVNNLNFVTVTSEKADANYVSTLAKILIPTILRLLEKINPAAIQTPDHEIPDSGEASLDSPEDSEETLSDDTLSEEHDVEPTEPEPAFVPEVDSTVPEPTANQFIVENIGGLLVPSDTVRVDNQLTADWTETYGGKKIEDVEIETFGGKVVQCKVKPIKDSKYEGKGIIQMPEKIQAVLEVKKGELVKVKPVIP